MRKSLLNVVPGFLFVAAAAAMWGTDAIFRAPLTEGFPSGLLVFLEHAILALMVIPFLRGAMATLRTLDAGDWVSLILIGAGASALATALFTQSFTYGEFTTTLLLQKLQPLVVVFGAWWILGERPLRRYWAFFVPAVVGAWLITFSDPFDVRVGEAAPALYALAAAVLWGLGTVLGRRLTPKIEFRQLTALRFVIGLPAAALIVTVQSDWGFLSNLGGGDILGTAEMARGLTVPGGLILLALVPGLIALLSYYRGLRTTPALAATLAELTFPLTAIFVNFVFLEVAPDGSQWLGMAILATTIVTMGVASARMRTAQAAGVEIVDGMLAAEPA